MANEAPQNAPKENEIDITEIETVLKELKNNEFFQAFRATVKKAGTFFDNEKDYTTDDSTARTTLDLFFEGLNTDDKETTARLSAEQVELFKLYLAPESHARKVIEAFYKIGAETTWGEAADNISGLQTFNNINFPEMETVHAIFTRLNHSTADWTKPNQYCSIR